MASALTRFIASLLNPTPLGLDALLATPRSTVPHTVTPLDDRPGGPRVVSAPDAGLVVGLAHHTRIAALTALPHFAAGVGYATLSHGSISVPALALRAGESLDGPARLAQHLADPPAPIEAILLVGPADPVFSPFGRDESLAVQYLLHGLALRAARAVVHGAPPQRPVLLDREPQRLLRWVQDLAPMLRSCTPLFEPCAVLLLPRPVVAEPEGAGEVEPRGVARGYHTVLPPGLTEGVGVSRYALRWRGLAAQATVAGDWTVLHAGTTVDPTDHAGVQSCIADKRARMREQGVLQGTAGGLLRLTRDVGLPSLTNALRVVTGTNEPGHHWQPSA